MTYFEYTRRDVMGAKRELAELFCALADDTSRKMNDEEIEYDRTYLLEDLLTRIAELADAEGRDVARGYDSLYAGTRPVPAYDLLDFPRQRVVLAESQETTQEISAVGRVAKSSIQQAAMLQTWDGGYGRHTFVNSIGSSGCGARLTPWNEPEAVPVYCTRPRNHEIHNITPEV